MGKILDERYFLHRYKATSHAGVVMAVLMGGVMLGVSIPLNLMVIRRWRERRD